MTARSAARTLSIIACVAAIVAPALAGDADGPGGNNGQGVCRTDGAWIGSAPDFGITFMAVYDAESHWWGTIDLTWIGGDPTFFGSFPDAVAFSEVKGQCRCGGADEKCGGEDGRKESEGVEEEVGEHRKQGR